MSVIITQGYLDISLVTQGYEPGAAPPPPPLLVPIVVDAINFTYLVTDSLGFGIGAVMSYGTGVYVVGNVVEFYFPATTDGSPWDLTDATVTLYLQRPDGTILARTATVSGTPGTASYVTTISDLNVSGYWSRWWNVVQGSLNETSIPFGFYVFTD